MTKLAMDNYLPGLADGSAGELAHRGRQLHVSCRRSGAPRRWSTTRNRCRSNTAPPSLGDLFNPANKAGRGASALGAGRDGPLAGRRGQAAACRGWTATPTWARWSSCGTSRWPRPSRPRATSSSGGRARTRPSRLHRQRRDDRPVLGFDRLQPAQRRLRLHAAGGRRLRLAPGLRADEERRQRRAGA